MAGRTVDSIRVGLGLDIAEIRTQREEVKRILRELATGPDSKRTIKITAKVDIDTNVLNKAQRTIQDHMNRVMAEINRQGVILRPRITISKQAARDVVRQINDELRNIDARTSVKVKAQVQFTAADARAATTAIQNAMSQAGPVKIGFDWYWVTPPPTGGAGGPGGGPAGRGGAPSAANPASRQAPTTPQQAANRTRPAQQQAATPPPPPPPAAQTGGTGSRPRTPPPPRPRPARASQTAAPAQGPTTTTNPSVSAEDLAAASTGGLNVGGQYMSRSNRGRAAGPAATGIPRALTDEYLGPQRGVRGARLAGPGVTQRDIARRAMQRGQARQAMATHDEFMASSRSGRRFADPAFRQLYRSLHGVEPHPDADTQELLEAMRLWTSDPEAAAARGREIRGRLMGSGLSEAELAALPRGKRSAIKSVNRFFPKVWSGRASVDRADPDTGRMEPRQQLRFFQAQALAALGVETATIRDPGRVSLAADRGRQAARRSRRRDYTRDRRERPLTDEEILREREEWARIQASRPSASSAGNMADVEIRRPRASRLPGLLGIAVRQSQGLIPGAGRMTSLERQDAIADQERLMRIRRRAGAMGPFPEEHMFATGGLATKRGRLRFRNGVGLYTDPQGQRYGMRFEHEGNTFDSLNVYRRGGQMRGNEMPDWKGHIGRVMLPKAPGGGYEDVSPAVSQGYQGLGIGSAAYAMLAALGIDVEGMSDYNAANVGKGHYQTQAGAAFWRSRKRFQGMGDARMADILTLGMANRGAPTVINGVLQLNTGGQWTSAPMRSGAGGGLYSSRMPAPYWSGGRYPPNAQHPDAILVGERGPEVLVPETNAYIIPNHMRGQLDSHSRSRRQTVPSKQAEDIWRNSRRLPSGWAAGGRTTPRFAAGSPGGLGGRFMSPADVAAMQAMQRQAAIAHTGGINQATPVTVTNWPAGIAAGGAAVQQQIQGLQAMMRAQQQQMAQRPAARAAQPIQNANPNAPAGPGNVQTPAGPAPARAGARGSISPLQASQALIRSRGSAFGMREQLNQIGADISEAQQNAPARALSVAFGQIAQNAIGGRAGILERSRRAAELAGRAQRTVSAFETAQGNVEEARFEARQIRAGVGRYRQGANETPQAYQARIMAARQANAERFLEERSSAQFLRGEAQKQTESARSATAGIISRPQQVRALAVSAGAIGVGTVAFASVMTGLQLGLQGLSAVLGPAVNAMRGFASTATDSQKQLAEGIRAAGGGTGSAAGALRASIGLSSDVNLRGLVSNAERQTQLENLTQQIDLIRSSGFFDRQGARGIRNGLGNGPLAGTPFDLIGQTQGLDQLLSERLFQGTGGLRNAVTKEDLDRTIGGGLFNGTRETVDTLQRNIMAGYGDVAAQQAQLNDIFKEYGLNQTELTESANKKLDFINAQLKKSGDTARFGSVSQERADQTAAALRDAGLGDLAEIFRAGRIGVTGTGAVNGQALAESLLKSTQFADPRALIDQARSGIQAQTRGIQRGLAFQQSSLIPAGIFQQQLANPIASSAGQGLDARAVGPDVIRRIGALRSEYQKLGETGRAALIDLGVTPEQIKGVEELSLQIRDINEQSQNMQLAYEQVQYNRQLFVTRRTLSDVVGLSGRQAVTVNGTVVAASRLGQLQRQQLEDSREQTKISLAANRREIEFALALARLNTPGSTPAERATRRHEAELIAQEQRRQLQLAERQNRTGIGIQNIQIDRDLKDTIYALQDLQRGRALTLQIRGNERLVEATQAIQAARMEGINASRDAGVQTKQLMLNTVASIEEASKDFTGNVEKEVRSVFRTIVTNAKQAYNDFLVGAGVTPTSTKGTGGTGGKGGKGGAQTYMGGRAFAAGWNAYVDKPTRFTAGDAGGEQVIVLRNPRAGSIAGGGGRGGGMVFSPVINISGTQVQHESDIDRIAAKVQRALNEQAMLMGVGTGG